MLVSDEMREAGNNMATTLLDIGIDSCLNNTDEKDLDLSTIDNENMDLVSAYVNQEKDSVTCIFEAMYRKMFKLHK